MVVQLVWSDMVVLRCAGLRSDQYRFVCERIRFWLTLIMFPKKVKSSEIALQVTDTRIEVVQKERKPFALFPLLAGFLLLFFALSFTLPSTAGATVAAYMDVQGNLHYVRGKSSRTNKKDSKQSTEALIIATINERFNPSNNQRLHPSSRHRTRG